MRFKIIPLFFVIYLFLFLGVSPIFSENIPDPETFFGHKPGADFKLIRWEKIHEYFNILGKTSDESAPEIPVSKPSLAEPCPAYKILVAEDNLINQKVVCYMLEKNGHQVISAHNGKEALKALEKHLFNVILMDVQMPEMDGFEATAAIREKEKETNNHIPIVALTAHAMKGDRERCLEAGMDDYVAKPIKPEELFTTINRVIKKTSPKPSEVKADRWSYS